MSSLMEQVSSSSVISLVSRLFSSQYCISRITDSRQRYWRLPESDSDKTVAHTEDTGEHWDETDTFPESVSDETVAHTEDTGEVSEDTVDFYLGPEEEELPF